MYVFIHFTDFEIYEIKLRCAKNFNTSYTAYPLFIMKKIKNKKMKHSHTKQGVNAAFLPRLLYVSHVENMPRISLLLSLKGALGR